MKPEPCQPVPVCHEYSRDFVVEHHDHQFPQLPAPVVQTRADLFHHNGVMQVMHIFKQEHCLPVKVSLLFLFMAGNSCIYDIMFIYGLRVII